MSIFSFILATMLALAPACAAPTSAPSKFLDERLLGLALPQMEELASRVRAVAASSRAANTGLIDTKNDQTDIASSDNLYKYCEYAGAAYKVAGTAWDCPVNCNSTNTAGTVVDYHWSLKSIPSYGYVAHKDDTKEIIVSWRGSTVFMDWVADFTFMSTSWPAQIDGAKVHLGFLSAYNAAAGKVKDVVAGLVQTYPDYRIVLTGHSLGGAQAVLAAVDIATTRPEWISRIELYTFGQPRVGNSAFSNWLSKLPIPIFRTVYRSDIVPQVPLQAMGFQHQAQEVWYDLNMQTKFCGSNAENLSCQNSLSMAKWSALNHLQYPGLSFDPRYIITGKLEVIT